MQIKAYRNLRSKTWSIQTKVGKRWLVTNHPSNVFLEDAVFKVSEAGRQRVLKEQRKNVHAKVCGTLVLKCAITGDFTWIELTYNPYKYETFVIKSTGEPVTKADQVYLRYDNTIWARGASTTN